MILNIKHRSEPTSTNAQIALALRNGKAAHREKAELDSQTENSHCLRDFPLGLVFLYVFRRLFIQMVWGIDALGNSAMLGGWTAL